MTVKSFDGCGRCNQELLRLRLIADLPDVTLVTGSVPENEALPDGCVFCGQCAAKNTKSTYVAKGCPVSYAELIYILGCINDGISPLSKTYPVCLECKLKENSCLFKDGVACKGPVTEAGCGAKCPSASQPCSGCRGNFDGANTELWDKLVSENK